MIALYITHLLYAVIELPIQETYFFTYFLKHKVTVVLKSQPAINNTLSICVPSEHFGIISPLCFFLILFTIIHLVFSAFIFSLFTLSHFSIILNTILILRSNSLLPSPLV